MEQSKALNPLGPANVFPLYYLFLLAQGKKENILSHKPCKIGNPCAKICLEMHAGMTLLEPVEHWIQTGEEFSFRYDGIHFSKASGIVPTLLQLPSGQVLLYNLFKDDDWNSYRRLL